MRRTPAIALAALITLAIGIGAKTAVFSVVDGVLLRPLPYPDPERLGLIWIHSPGIGIFQDWPSPGHFLDIKAQNRSFENMALVHGGTRTLTGGEEPVRVEVLRTSSTLFAMLGAQPMIGRLFSADDDGAGPAADRDSEPWDVDHGVRSSYTTQRRWISECSARRILPHATDDDPPLRRESDRRRDVGIRGRAAGARRRRGELPPARRATRVDPLVALRDE